MGNRIPPEEDKKKKVKHRSIIDDIVDTTEEVTEGVKSAYKQSRPTGFLGAGKKEIERAAKGEPSFEPRPKVEEEPEEEVQEELTPIEQDIEAESLEATEFEDEEEDDLYSPPPPPPPKPKGPLDGLTDIDTALKQFNITSLPDLTEKMETIDKDLVKELAVAGNMYVKEKDALAKKEMWEAIVHAVGHLAAGFIGERKGLNLGGIKFDKQNWDEKQKMIMAELENARRQSTMSAEAKRNLAKTSFDQAALKQQLGMQVFENAQNRAIQQQRLVHDQYQMRLREWEVRQNMLVELAKKAKSENDKALQAQLKQFKEKEKEVKQNMHSWIQTHKKKPSKASADRQRMINEVAEYQQMANALGVTPAYRTGDFEGERSWIVDAVTFGALGPKELDPEEVLKKAGERRSTEVAAGRSTGEIPAPARTIKYQVGRGSPQVMDDTPENRAVLRRAIQQNPDIRVIK